MTAAEGAIQIVARITDHIHLDPLKDASLTGFHSSPSLVVVRFPWKHSPRSLPSGTLSLAWIYLLISVFLYLCEL